MRDFRIRCSALGKIMTEPKSKSETLSVGAKTYIRSIAREDIYGIESVVSSKYFDKGIRCEQEAIDLYNAVHFTDYTKNTERKTDDFITGECDIAGPVIIDIKCPWSIDSFPIAEVDAISSDYEWQLRGYMRLWGADKARVAYCLINTPADLIGFEAPQLHNFDHVSDSLRVTVWDIERDADKEARIVEKVKAARAYYAEVIAEFERTH
jgi:hypothetical protein